MIFPLLKRIEPYKRGLVTRLTVLFHYRGVVHYEFLTTGQTVNKEYYLSIMRHLREASPELWAKNS